MVARNGRGMGDWIWVTPGEPTPPPVDIAPRFVTKITAWHRTESVSHQVDDETRSNGVDVAEGLEEFSHTDSQPGYGAFYYDPGDEEIGDLSDDLSPGTLSGGSPPARSEVVPSKSASWGLWRFADGSSLQRARFSPRWPATWPCTRVDR